MMSYSDVALKILSEAVQSKHGSIITVETHDGLSIQTNSKLVYYSVFGRKKADIYSALEELVSGELIEQLGKGSYGVTKKGYDYLTSNDIEPTA